MKKLHTSPVQFAPFVLLLTGVLFWAPMVFADPTPVVEIFTASPSYISNDGTVLLSWTAGAATGDDLYFSCPVGVTVTLNGGSFPCNARQTYSSNMSDSGSFVITNVSGTTQTVTITAYPKDSSGNDYDAGAKSTTFIVTSSPAPITNFTLSATAVNSGMPLTLAWTGVDAPGVNIEFDCNANVHISTATTTGMESLPCGTAAFSPDLALSGTTTVIMRNTSSQPVTILLHAVPQIAVGAYDMTHARSASLTIDSTSLQTQPTATSLTSAPASIVSGVPFTLSWTTQNAAGANIELTCSNSAVTATYLVGTTSVSMPCNTPAFASVLPANGNTTIQLVQAVLGSSATFELLPEGADGTYYATSARTLTIPFASSGTVATSVIQPTATTTAPFSTSMVPASWQHYTFTRALQRGSQNADVTALQSYLALDPSIYPLGLVTGYFGAATLQAVELFQLKYQIAAPGNSGYGLVGPKTRAELNMLQ